MRRQYKKNAGIKSTKKKKKGPEEMDKKDPAGRLQDFAPDILGRSIHPRRKKKKVGWPPSRSARSLNDFSQRQPSRYRFLCLSQRSCRITSQRGIGGGEPGDNLFA